METRADQHARIGLRVGVDPTEAVPSPPQDDNESRLDQKGLAQCCFGVFVAAELHVETDACPRPVEYSHQAV